MSDEIVLLSTIIVSYNTSDLTQQAVTAVLREYDHSPLLRNKCEVIVVDNASTDQSVAALKQLAQRRPELTILSNHENLGFSIANNQGLSRAKGQYLLLLNSDTIVQPSALTQLVEMFEQKPIQEQTAHLESAQNKIDKLGILAATLMNADSTLQPQGGSEPTLVSLASHMLMLDDIPGIGKLLPSTQHTGLRQTEKLRYQLKDNRLLKRDWVGGTALMLRREVLDEIGMLDEGIFMYGEDVELCIRAKNHHWDIAIHPNAKIIHLGMASSSSENAIVGEFKGYLYLWSKHKPLWQLPLLRLLLKTGALIRTLVFGTILRDHIRGRIYWQLAQTLPTL